MSCGNNRLIVEMKQGESRSFAFTLKNKTGSYTNDKPDYEPYNLNDCIIEFDIKEYPFESVTPIIHKVLTTNDVSDSYILQPPENGKFVVNMLATDTIGLSPDKEYSLVITLVNGDTRIIISADDNNSGVFRFCKQ